MSQLRLKVKTELGKAVYSICLRGARKYPYNIYGPDSIDLEIFTTNPSTPTYTAKIVSQVQMRFIDLMDEDCRNNYDPNATGYMGLFYAMRNVYPDFDAREIITLINFEVQ